MKISFDQINPICRKAIDNVFQTYKKAGFECYLVGGAPRDMLRGVDPKDFDFATNASIGQTKTLFPRVIETGVQHGTVTIRIGNESFEVTRFRKDVDTDGRRASVEFVDDIETDLSRRDLVINAIAVDSDGNVIDPYNGVDDLKNNRVRFVGNADERMQEDYLRILRWIRFQGRIGNGSALDIDTVKAAMRNAKGLDGISRERVWMEVSKIISGPNGPWLMQDIQDIGIGAHIDLPKGDATSAASVALFTKNPVTLMTAFVSGSIPMETLASNWKWSAAERDLAVFLEKYRGADLETMKSMIAVDGAPKEWVYELAMLNEQPTAANTIKNWMVPKFPVTGGDLIAKGYKPGPEMGKELRRLRTAWRDSDYKLTKEEMIG